MKDSKNCMLWDNWMLITKVLRFIASFNKLVRWM